MSTSRPLRRIVVALAFLASLAVPQVAQTTTANPPPAGEPGSGPETWLAASEPTGRVTWTDVGRKHWARMAIDHVGATNPWMRDYRATADGTYPFKPEAMERRKLFARTLVRAFAGDVPQDPDVVFPDLPASDRFERFANVVVSLDWMQTDAEGNFQPGKAVTMRDVHHALVHAVGLGDLATGAEQIRMENGTSIPTPQGFGTLLIGMRLGLRYNHGDESLDVGPDSPLPRSEVAWSLYRASTTPTWVRDSLAAYASIELPNLSEAMQRVVAFGASYVGYPYVWGGEWHERTPAGYCCGYQPVGGFDCSGITWWVMKEGASGWGNVPPRDYTGWALPERSSAGMSKAGTQVRWKDLQPGDLLFYDGEGDGRVDHVNTFIGNGWAIDSGSSSSGVTFTRVVGNWYQDHFVRGRRILG